jgi:hypothetical protein
MNSTLTSYHNCHLDYVIFFSCGLSIIELLGIWPTVKFTFDATTLSSCTLSLTPFLLLSRFLLLPLLPISPIVFTCNLAYINCENLTIWVSLNKLTLSNQHMPHFRCRHMTLATVVSYECKVLLDWPYLWFSHLQTNDVSGHSQL